MGSSSDKEKWKNLLKKVKVFKDNVHGDIWLSKTEIDIIDTPEFQRLQYILQLGPSYLVYRGATHTRFSHSLGTLYMAQRIIEAVNRNYNDFDTGFLIEDEDVFLTRLCALMHDIVYITNDHILEGEGQLIKEKQWQDKERVNYFLGRDKSSIYQILIKNICTEFGNKEGKKIFNKIIKEIIEILSAEKDEQINNLDKPFIADIVHNTICADLLDYLKRDIYHTGIQGLYGERMITYFVIQEHDEKKRLVLKLFKKDPSDYRQDVVSEILEALRLRYSLSEKVYFHHTKRSASAMIIKMVASLFKSNLLKKQDLYMLNDFSLLHYPFIYSRNGLSDEQKKYLDLSKRISEKIQSRKIYKTIYVLNENQYSINRTIMERVDEMENWEARFDFESQIENTLGLDNGSIIIHVPGRGMGLKEANVLVKSKHDIETLEQLAKNHTEFKLIIDDEIELIKNKHKSLWKFIVFGSPEIMEDKDMVSTIKAICEQWFEAKEPVTIVEALCRQEKISVESSYAAVASSIIQGFNSSPRRPSSGTCNYKDFCEYAKNELSKINQISD